MALKAPSFSFCADPAPCKTLWEALLAPLADAPPFSSGLEEALKAALSPAWEGAAHPKGRSFLGALICHLSSALFTPKARGPKAPSPEMAQLLSDAIERAASWPEAETVFKKLVNHTAPLAVKLAGPYARGVGDKASARLVLLCIARHAPSSSRSSLAAKLCSAWALRSEAQAFHDMGLFTSVYAACFEQGASVNDVFNLQPRVGLSVNEQLRERILRMPESELRSLLLSSFEREFLTAPSSPLAPSPMDVKGLPSETLRSLLAAVGALEEALPGQGAQAALDWLALHPALAAAKAALPEPAAPPPSKPAARL